MKVATRSNETERDWVLYCLRFAVSALFLGRGYLYLSDLAPLSAFLWNQDLLERPLEWLTGMSWESYSAHSEGFILTMQRTMGMLFLAAALPCWYVRGSRRRLVNGLVLAAGLFLFVYGLLRWSDADFRIAMLLEQSLQWGAPLLLMLYGRVRDSRWTALAALLIAATFIGHGCYALGLSVPQNHEFVNMTMRALSLGRPGALIFLHAVGVLDFLVPVLFWVPKLRLYALAYAAFWGLLTAFARIFSYWTPAEDFYGMHPWVAETIVRLPHGLIPLALLLIYLMKDSHLHKSSSGTSL
ncbi:hypothetical protein DDZ13_02505 [Coraliomargarita sinensis]|uniref:Uncharacterized protein n=1 Tax=Coraliomargarita sinensis TaxID=2174842 RepID=A0A317ZPH9_9BACT|nr:hypothetical protein [Coraliomargarita sinensis]PXA05759.1 hypothetical protein DDZ13_02505 [Coraliomargarita sinensis]